MTLLAGKVGLVTGGASGIGAAIAEAFCREGGRILIADIDEAGAVTVAQSLCARGAEAHALRVDVTREDEVEAAIARCLERFGRLDCAINNAGTTGAAGGIAQLRLEDWRATFAVNLESVFLCLKHELRCMQAQGSGSIVNVASGAGLVAVPGLAAYCASKHGVLGLTKTAAAENARSGIRVNAICPGSTDTPMIRRAMQASPPLEKRILAGLPSGRLGRPEEIAEAAIWLCSDRASYVSGESMLVDGAAVAR